MANRVKNFIRLSGDKNELDRLQSMITYTYAGENKGATQTLFAGLVPLPRDSDEKVCIECKREHWGTISEADEVWYCRINQTMLELSFESSWATPKKVFEAITKQFPSVMFGGYYADEVYGYNCGLIMGNESCVVSIDMGDGSDSAVVFSEKVWDMVADEIYTGKTLEKVIKRPIPEDFIKMGLGYKN